MGIFKKNLELYKAHDYSAVKEPLLTVVFIHGIASDSGSFANALKYLEGTTSLRDARFVAFDLLGAGKSETSDKLNYDYHDQVEALHNSIEKLKIKTPLVLVGHSMGTLIATRYADTYKRSARHLILISPPVYTPENLAMPEFQLQIQAFKKLVAQKDKKYINDRAFEQEINKIVLNKYNYARLLNLKTHASLIYSRADAIIAPFNVHKVAKENAKYLTEITTEGTHSVARDKYTKIPEILEKIINGGK